jgi:putative endonuclease
MTRSAVRSRLAPPAFARFASYGSASHAGLYRSEVSEGWWSHSPQGEGGPAMKYVYILESLDTEHFYVGVADDVPARLAKHNAGEVPHTSKYRPWQLKTYIAFSDDKKAFAFERHLKSGSGRAFQKKHL